MIDAPHPHQSHPAIVNRLRRAEGHLRKVIAMIEEDRPCLDVAQQLHAVEGAITGARTALIKDHLEHCIDALVAPLTADQRRDIEDFKAIAKYL